MLLCIEMAIFSVMHLFAFGWKGYKLPDDPLNASDNVSSGPPLHYQGGRLGIKAYADAFNPWDIFKATARGFRWLFVGRRHRFEDPSYKGLAQPGSKLGSIDGSVSNERFGRPARAGSNQPATEMVPGTRGRTEHDTTESDTAGLLAHAHNTSPQQHAVAPSSGGDIGMQHTSRVNTNIETPMPSAYGGHDDFGMHPGYGSPSTDTGYHAPSAAPSAAAPIGAAYGGQPGEWDMWAGANRKDHPNDSSNR